MSKAQIIQFSKKKTHDLIKLIIVHQLNEIWKIDTKNLNQSLFHFSLKSKADAIAAKPSSYFYFFTAGPDTSLVWGS